MNSVTNTASYLFAGDGLIPIDSFYKTEIKADRMNAEEAYKLLFRGDYAELVLRLVDQGKPVGDVRCVAPVVGAMTFVGRITEAELLFKKFFSALSPTEKIIARFFLGVVNCRHFHFEKARRCFAENARELRSILKQFIAHEDLLRIKFFVYQGFGFHRYTYGRLRPAMQWAEKAYGVAFEADFLFGRLFSQDLKAHVQVNLGRVHSGLRSFEQNIELAKSLGRGALISTFRVTRAIYRARFGISGNDSIEELLSLLAETTHEDGYSRACLFAELSQQYLLRGNGDKAKEMLDLACESVYRIDNPRLEILLNFRMSVLHWYRGEMGQALYMVRQAKERLINHVDRSLELRVRGFEDKLLSLTNHNDNFDERREWIIHTTRRTGFAVAYRMLKRSKLSEQETSLRGQDPLGDLIDDIDAQKSNIAIEVIESGWLGLLHRLLKVDTSQKTLFIGIHGKSLTIFENGNVRHFPRGASNQVAKFLICLSGGEKTKEQIIQQVWNQSYHPLRHDPLLYTLVSKLRKELGRHSSWVEANENGYQLQEGVRLRVITANEAPIKLPIDKAEICSTIDSERSEWNFRQMKIMSYLEGTEAIDVATCETLFQVSSATANRDLSHLEKNGWVIRSGKGRATQYHRRERKLNEVIS